MSSDLNLTIVHRCGNCASFPLTNVEYYFHYLLGKSTETYSLA